MYLDIAHREMCFKWRSDVCFKWSNVGLLIKVWRTLLILKLLRKGTARSTLVIHYPSSKCLFQRDLLPLYQFVCYNCLLLASICNCIQTCTWPFKHYSESLEHLKYITFYCCLYLIQSSSRRWLVYNIVLICTNAQMEVKMDGINDIYWVLWSSFI